MLAKAQLCEGSLGDPVVTIDFGQGSNPGPALSNLITTYEYRTISCPDDGQYAIVSQTANCFVNTWHSLPEDHTPNDNGYFMLINAAQQPGVFYTQKVTGLCGGTTYELAAWIVNVLKNSSCGGTGLMPDILFQIEQIDGTVLQSYNTGSIAATANPEWKQYGFYFATPPNVTDLVLRLVNNAPGGCGNDLGIDDITFRACGSKIISTINGNANQAIVVCDHQPTNYLLQAIPVVNVNTVRLQWQQKIDLGNWTDIPGANTTKYQIAEPNGLPYGRHYYRMAMNDVGSTNPTCKLYSEIFRFASGPIPVTKLTSNNILCEGESLTISIADAFSVVIRDPRGNSSTSSGTTDNSIHSIIVANTKQEDAGIYTITVSNEIGCRDITRLPVTVNPLPNAQASANPQLICEGEKTILTAEGGVEYIWNPKNQLSNFAIASPVASPTDTIKYSVLVTSDQGCKKTADITVNVVEKPRVNAGPDRIVVKGYPITINATATGQDIKFEWSPDRNISDNNLLRPEVEPVNDIEYTVRAISNYGCEEARDVVGITVYNDLYIPNAFTPNGDGKNDSWNITTLTAFPNAEVWVYNRSGQLVYHCSKSCLPWDGKLNGVEQGSGVFVYMVDLKVGVPVFKGSLTLIR